MLLDLPPEMRLRVYDFLLAPIPLSKPPSQFTGLLFSCRQIRHELEHIIVTRMQNYLLNVRRRCTDGNPKFEWAPLNTFNDAYNLRIFRGMKVANFKRRDPMMVLFYLYFGTLTIKMRLHPFSDSDDQNAEDILACLNTTTSYRKTNVEKYRRCHYRHQLSRPELLGCLSRNVESLRHWIIQRHRSEDTPAARSIICDWSTEPWRNGYLTNLTPHRLIVGKWNIEALENEEFGELIGIEYSKVGN